MAEMSTTPQERAWLSFGVLYRSCFMLQHFGSFSFFFFRLFNVASDHKTDYTVTLINASMFLLLQDDSS